MSVIRARDAGNVERGMQVLEAVLDRDARCDLALNAYALLLSEQLEGEHHRPQVPAHGQQHLDQRPVPFDTARAHAIMARALQQDPDSVGAQRLGAVLAHTEGGSPTMSDGDSRAAKRTGWQGQRSTVVGAVWEFATRCACVNVLACLRHASLPRAESERESTLDMLSDSKTDNTALRQQTAPGRNTCAADASTLPPSASPAHLVTRDLTTTTEVHDSSMSAAPQLTPQTPSASLEEGDKAHVFGAPDLRSRSDMDSRGMRHEVPGLVAQHQKEPARSAQSAGGSGGTHETRLLSPTGVQDEEYQQETWLCDEAANVLNLFDSATPGKSSESLSPSTVVDMIRMFNTPRSERRVAAALLEEQDASPAISVQRIQNGNLDRFRRSRLRACPSGSPRVVDGTVPAYMMSGQDLVNRVSPVASGGVSLPMLTPPAGPLEAPVSLTERRTGSEQPHSNTRSWDTDFSMGADSRSSNKGPRGLPAVDEVATQAPQVDAEKSASATPIAHHMQPDVATVQEGEPKREHSRDSKRDQEPMEESDSQDAMLYDSIDASDAHGNEPAQDRDAALAPDLVSMHSTPRQDGAHQRKQDPKGREAAGRGVSKPAWRQVGLAKRLQRALARAQGRNMNWSTLDLGSLFASPGSSAAQRQAASVVVASAALRFGGARVRQAQRAVPASSKRPTLRGRLVTPVPRGSKPVLRRSLAGLLGASSATVAPSADVSARHACDTPMHPQSEPRENVQAPDPGVVSEENSAPASGRAEIGQACSASLPCSVDGARSLKAGEEEATGMALDEEDAMSVDQGWDEAQEVPHAVQRISFSQQDLSDIEQAFIDQPSDEECVSGVGNAASGSQPLSSRAQDAVHENVATASRHVGPADQDWASLSLDAPVGDGFPQNSQALSQAGNTKSYEESEADARMSAGDADPVSRVASCPESRDTPRVLRTDGHASPQLAKGLSPVEGAEGAASPSVLATPLENESSLIRREQEWLAAHAESALAIDSYSRVSPLLRGKRAESGAMEVGRDSACSTQDQDSGHGSAQEMELPLQDSMRERRTLLDEPFSLSMPRNVLTDKEDQRATQDERLSDPDVHVSIPSAGRAEGRWPLGAQQAVSADSGGGFEEGHAGRDEQLALANPRPRTPSATEDEEFEDDAGGADATEVADANGPARWSDVESAVEGEEFVAAAEASTPRVRPSDELGDKEAAETWPDADANHRRTLLPDGSYYEDTHQTPSRSGPRSNVAAAQSEEPRGEEPGHAGEPVAYTALRGVAFRSKCSRADKHKILDEAGKPCGVRQGQSLLASRCDSLGKPRADGGWLHVTDGRFVQLSAAVYLPLATVVGEGLLVQVEPRAPEVVTAPTGYGYRLGSREASVLSTVSSHQAAMSQARDVPMSPSLEHVAGVTNGSPELVNSMQYVDSPAARQPESANAGSAASADDRLQTPACQVSEHEQGEGEDMPEESDAVISTRSRLSEHSAEQSVRGDAAQADVPRPENAFSEQEGGLRAGNDDEDGEGDEGTQTLGGDGAANDDTQVWQDVDAHAEPSAGEQDSPALERTGGDGGGEVLSQDSPVWRGAKAVFASPSATLSAPSPMAAHMLAQARSSATPLLTVDFAAAGPDLRGVEEGRLEVADTPDIAEEHTSLHAGNEDAAGDGQEVLEAGSETKCNDVMEEDVTEERQVPLQPRSMNSGESAVTSGGEAGEHTKQQSEIEQRAVAADQPELYVESEGWEEMTDALSLPQEVGDAHAYLSAHVSGEEAVAGAEEEAVAGAEEEDGQDMLLDGDARARSLPGDVEAVSEVDVEESGHGVDEDARGMASDETRDESPVREGGEGADEEGEEADDQRENGRASSTLVSGASSQEANGCEGEMMMRSAAPAASAARAPPPPPPQSPAPERLEGVEAASELHCPHCGRGFAKRSGGMTNHVRACANKGGGPAATSGAGEREGKGQAVLR